MPLAPGLGAAGGQEGQELLARTSPSTALHGPHPPVPQCLQVALLSQWEAQPSR